MQNLSIGAVVKITGIPAHTLRKWESRHGIAIPIRTETARRVYTEEHVEQLKLVKTLVENRHSLAQLAGLSLAELRDLANLHYDTPASNLSPKQISLIGPGVNRLLSGDPRITQRLSQGNTVLEAQRPPQTDTVVIECDTIPAHTQSVLSSWQADGCQLIVVYKFASRASIAHLTSLGAICARGPVTDASLLAILSAPPAPTEKPPASPAKFTDEELNRIAQLSPGLACECPNHIAKLLMDITSFERYSNECIDTDPAEHALHQQLASVSAQARQLFEGALLTVATAEGIKLEPKE